MSDITILLILAGFLCVIGFLIMKEVIRANPKTEDKNDQSGEE